MMTFQQVKFGDLYSVPSRNGVYKPKQFHGHGYRIVNMGEMFEYNFIGTQEMSRVELSTNEISSNDLQKGDLLFGRRSLVEAGAGKCSLVVDNDEQITFESSIIRVRLDQKQTNPRYLYYYFLSPTGHGKIHAIVSGTNVKGIRGSDLNNISIPLPPKPLQDLITEKLKTYDDLIENNKKRIKILEQIGQRLYTEWFVKFRFPGHKKVKMVDSKTEYGVIPEGWEVNKFSILADVISGYPFKSSTYKESGNYKIVTIKNVHEGEFILNFDSYIDELPSNLPEACILKQGDILLSLTGNVGRMCTVFGENHLLNQRVAKLMPRKSSIREYIYYMFGRDKFRKRMEAIANGAAQQNLSPIQMEGFKVIIPDAEVLANFSNITGNFFNLSMNLREQNQSLSNIRDLLIPQLVTGKREIC